MATGDLEQDLWSFMVQFYAQPGVAAACLQLQTDHCTDVPLFLAALYGAKIGHHLPPAALRALDQQCQTWRETVIHPLRKIRIAMKSEDILAIHPEAASLRDKIKAQELQAEKIEVQILAAALAQLPMQGAQSSHGALECLVRDCLDLTDPSRAVPLPTAALAILAAFSQRYTG